VAAGGWQLAAGSWQWQARRAPIEDRGGARCVFFYRNFDVAPLSLRLAKTDSHQI
jgi:hypothetical protein